MAKFNFNVNVTPRQNIRPIPFLALNRTLAEIDVSDSHNPALPLYPYKYLPVNLIDTVSQEGIVLIKGTIVSLLTNQTSIYPGVPASGIPVPTSSGSIPVTDDASTVAFDWIVANIDDDYFGYEQSILGLLVNANGGAASEVPFSSLDDTANTFTMSGLAPLQLGANMPAGIVYQDIYQDIRGFTLNYSMHDNYGIACRGFITVPFVDTNKATTFGSDADTQTVTLNTASPYTKLHKKYPFFYFSSAAGGGSSGQAVTSDKLGKFIPQGTGATTALTVQTVGLLKACDSRFPKDLVSTVQTYPGSGVQGTDTGGLPALLYHFAKDALMYINGVAPSNTAIITRVQGGWFGMARIALVLG